MIIWAISRIWNSQKLLPYFLRNYSFCDKIILYDFMSDDNSVEIAKADPLVDLRQTGKPLEVDILTTTAWINEVYKEARGQADWVMLPDGDEFFYCETGMRNALQDYMERGVTLPFVTGYNMFHDELPNTDGQLWEKYKQGVPHIMLNKPTVFNPELEMNFGHGQHGAHPTGNVVRDDTHKIKLLHYRYWGYDDLVDIHVKLWGRSSTRNKAGGHGGYNPKCKDKDVYNSIPWWEEEKSKRAIVI